MTFCVVVQVGGTDQDKDWKKYNEEIRKEGGRHAASQSNQRSVLPDGISRSELSILSNIRHVIKFNSRLKLGSGGGSSSFFPDTDGLI